jgi:hypothetical protein
MERVVRSQTVRLLVYAGLKSGPGHLSRRSGPLRAERSGDRMKEERNFTHQSIRP